MTYLFYLPTNVYRSLETGAILYQRTASVNK